MDSPLATGSVGSLVIGITGSARSGKDTAAYHLCELFGLRRIALADPLKDACSTAMSMPRESMDIGDRESKIPGFSFSIREMLQVIGTEGFRRLDSDVWVKLLERTHQRYMAAQYRGCVVPDVRYENEALWVRERGILIHVTRPGLGSVGVAGHPSEAGIQALPGEKVIDNSGSLSELYLRVTEAVMPYIAGKMRH